MQYRRLGKTGIEASAIGFGAWAIGADWGPVDDEESLRALHAAADAGVTFFDTADVYGDGHSERVIARFRKERREPIAVSYTHLRAHETRHDLVCRLLLEKKKTH